MIKINNVTKQYTPTTGSFDISAEINDSEVYAIVGPNGAGKTTLIRQILGFVKSDSGNIEMNGYDSWKDADKIMEFTGYVAGEVALFDNLTGMQYLKEVAKFKKDIDFEFVETLIKHFDLDPNKKIKNMSKGNKQKVAIIAGAMHKPKILVLDEPTSGLDPVMQIQFQEMLELFKNEFKSTIILCSHIFEEVTDLSDRIAFIKDGKLIEETKVNKMTSKELKQKFIKIYERENLLKWK